jgi:hypothetical protein
MRYYIAASSYWVLGLELALQALPFSEGSTAFGILSNFDVINDENKETHGFEIELKDIHKEDVTRTFGGAYSRYGDPIKEDKIDGMGNVIGTYVQYVSEVDRRQQKLSTEDHCTSSCRSQYQRPRLLQRRSHQRPVRYQWL